MPAKSYSLGLHRPLHLEKSIIIRMINLEMRLKTVDWVFRLLACPYGDEWTSIGLHSGNLKLDEKVRDTTHVPSPSLRQPLKK